jgi:FixJ family two-component response regulator
VESEPGRGTTFTVWLPRLESEGIEPPREALSIAGRGQVILAVDDEPEVLAALEEMLATLGYEPAGYTDSRTALEAFRAAPSRFEAVISDEVMPVLTGTQLVVELRSVNPAIPIVIATGFGGAGFETRALSVGVNRILRKPYRMQDIGEALRLFFGPA